MTYHEFLKEISDDAKLLSPEQTPWREAIGKLIALCRKLEEQRDLFIKHIRENNEQNRIWLPDDVYALMRSVSKAELDAIVAGEKT